MGGGGAAGGAPVVSQVFACTLYTGNGSAQTVTTGIDADLVWLKRRNGAVDHALVDAVRGDGRALFTSGTNAETNYGASALALLSTGFSMDGVLNTNTATYVSWSFARAARFFDVVTYTGTGSARTVAHSLGTAPGVIIVKRRDTTGAWPVYHRANTGAPETDYLLMNTTDATADLDTYWNDTAPTSSVFTVGTNADVNASGGTYVAYLFAHDTASDGIVQCGSYTGNGSATGPTVTLGWRPQFVMIKRASNPADWVMLDTARGITSGNDNFLWPNRSYSENGDAGFPYNGLNLTATGFEIFEPFTILNGAADTYVFLAIREV